MNRKQPPEPRPPMAPDNPELERQLADAHTRIREIDWRDELIAELQHRIEELEQSRG